MTVLENVPPKRSRKQKVRLTFVWRNRRRKAVLPDSKQKTPDGAADDEYRSRFLKVKLSGARRVTYINDILYRTI